MLWQIYYDMWWSLHPWADPNNYDHQRQAEEWATFCRTYNRTPHHYELSVHHR